MSFVLFLWKQCYVVLLYCVGWAPSGFGNKSYKWVLSYLLFLLLYLLGTSCPCDKNILYTPLQINWANTVFVFYVSINFSKLQCLRIWPYVFVYFHTYLQQRFSPFRIKKMTKASFSLLFFFILNVPNSSNSCELSNQSNLEV